MNKETIVCISIAAKPGKFGSTFHNSAYDLLDLNWIYIPRRVENALDLKRAIDGLRALNIKGCSVSMPHKEKVIKFLDELDFSAKKIGAVNTIKQLEDGALRGYNTDFYGAKKALEKAEIKGEKVLMLGSGGAAKAVGLAVKVLGGILTIVNRTYERAIELGEKLDSKVILWEQINSTSGYMLINTTSIGMNNPNKMIVKKDLVRNFDFIMDIVVYPAETKLLRISKELGKEIIPGTLMCVYQAAEQFKIYTGLDAPEEVIKSTLKALDK